MRADFWTLNSVLLIYVCPYASTTVSISLVISFEIKKCEFFNFVLIQDCFRDFPGGPVVKNPPSNAGDVGLILGQGTKIPHAAGQLSLCAATTEHMGHN